MSRATKLIAPALYAAIVASGAGAIAITWPQVAKISQNRSAVLAKAPTNPEPLTEAALRLKLATWLDPENQNATLSLAKVKLELGQTAEAISLLKSVAGLPEASTLLIRTEIEQGEYQAASKHSATALKGADSDEVVALTILSHCLTGSSGQLADLNLRLSEGNQRTLLRAQAGHTLLGDELRMHKLPNAAIRVLSAEPSSYARNITLAKVLQSRRQSGDIINGLSLLETAVAIDPSQIQAHEMLREAYNDLGNTEQAAQQDILIQQITAGRP